MDTYGLNNSVAQFSPADLKKLRQTTRFMSSSFMSSDPLTILSSHHYFGRKFVDEYTQVFTLATGLHFLI